MQTASAPLSDLWRRVDLFRPEEFGQAPDQFDPALILGLDAWRLALGRAVTIHPSSWSDTGHEPGSFHELKDGARKAVDCHPEGGDLMQAFLLATEIPAFQGIGLYPFWEPRPGLHLDTRPTLRRAYWWRDAWRQYRGLRTVVEWQLCLAALREATVTA